MHDRLWRCYSRANLQCAVEGSGFQLLMPVMCGNQDMCPALSHCPVCLAAFSALQQ
jgi:hypothetical protein